MSLDKLLAQLENLEGEESVEPPEFFAELFEDLELGSPSTKTFRGIETSIYPLTVTVDEHIFNGHVSNVPREALRGYDPGDPEAGIEPTAPERTRAKEGETLYAWNLVGMLPGDLETGKRKRAITLLTREMISAVGRIKGDVMMQTAQSIETEVGTKVNHRGMFSAPVSPEEVGKSLSEYISRLSILPKDVGGDDLAEEMSALLYSMRKL